MWKEIRRVRKENAPTVLFGSEPFSSLLRCGNLEEFKYDWVWEKSKASNFLLAKKQPLKAHELISVFGKGRILIIPSWRKVSLTGIARREEAIGQE